MLNYEDIINMPRHISKTRKPMSKENRAAQFAPFSALTGYAEKIQETSKITQNKIEITDEMKQILNNKLIKINQNIKQKPLITITYFIKDKIKKGGVYQTITKNIQKIDFLTKQIILTDETKININAIINLTENL